MHVFIFGGKRWYGSSIGKRLTTLRSLLSGGLSICRKTGWVYLDRRQSFTAMISCLYIRATPLWSTIPTACKGKYKALLRLTHHRILKYAHNVVMFTATSSALTRSFHLSHRLSIWRTSKSNQAARRATVGWTEPQAATLRLKPHFPLI